jgi:glucosamine--fructose-6-phosphate aminotransferase (isomerizing)
MIALKIGKGNFKDYSTVLEQLSDLPNTLKSVFDIEQDIKKIAEKYAEYRDFLFIGRGYEYPVALEGALKLKEISYIHAEGYAAGEMKHGPLAMIDEDFPTFAFAAGAELSEKTASNIQEIKARSGKAIVVTCEPTEQIKKLADELIVIPKVKDQLIPLVEAVVLQLFSYYVALKKGYDIDKPRNLAKSVTVE